VLAAAHPPDTPTELAADDPAAVFISHQDRRPENRRATEDRGRTDTVSGEPSRERILYSVSPPET
jgi:hypothetical protein